MGLLFQNVTQLAGFLMNDTGSSSKSIKGNGEQSDAIDFQSVLESMSNPKQAVQKGDSDQAVDDMAYLNTLLNSNFGAIAGLDSKLSQSIEVKERAGINADLLQVLVSNQKDSITINLSQSAISKLQGGLNFGDTQNQLTGSSPADTILKLNQEDNAGVTFNLKALLNSKLDLNSNFANNTADTTIPIATNDICGFSHQSEPKVSDLFKMLSEYPDPIDMEIGDLQDSIMVPDTINPAKSKLVSSTFKFDLRDLLNASPQEKVAGILTTSEKAVEKPIQNSNSVSNLVKPSIVDFPLSNGTATSLKFDTSINEIKSPILFDPPKTNSSSEKSGAKTADLLNGTIEGDNAIPKAAFNWFDGNQRNLRSRPAATSQPNDLAQNGDAQQSSGRKIQFASFHKNTEHKNSENQTSSSSGGNHTASVSNTDSDLPFSTGTIETIGADRALSPDISAALPESANMDQELVAANVREMKNVILEAFGQKNGLIRMKLQPENLGEISIRLLWKDNGLSVSMKAENKESHKILAAGAADLKGHLEAVNLRVNEVNVSTQSDWDGKNLHTSGQELAGDQKQSRQQRESSNESLLKRSGQWESDESSKDSTKKQRANSWVDLTA